MPDTNIPFDSQNQEEFNLDVSEQAFIEDSSTKLESNFALDGSDDEEDINSYLIHQQYSLWDD